jgi:hypothetical protein
MSPPQALSCLLVESVIFGLGVGFVHNDETWRSFYQFHCQSMNTPGFGIRVPVRDGSNAVKTTPAACFKLTIFCGGRSFPDIRSVLVKRD